MISRDFVGQSVVSRVSRAGADSLTYLSAVSSVASPVKGARGRVGMSSKHMRYHADDESTNMGSLMGKNVEHEGGWTEIEDARGGVE